MPGALQAAATLAIKAWHPPDNLFVLAVTALPGMAVYAAVFWLFFVEASEKDLLAEKLLHRLGRGRGPANG